MSLAVEGSQRTHRCQLWNLDQGHSCWDVIVVTTTTSTCMYFNNVSVPAAPATRCTRNNHKSIYSTWVQEREKSGQGAIQWTSVLSAWPVSSYCRCFPGSSDRQSCQSDFPASLSLNSSTQPLLHLTLCVCVCVPLSFQKTSIVIWIIMGIWLFQVPFHIEQVSVNSLVFFCLIDRFLSVSLCGAQLSSLNNICTVRNLPAVCTIVCNLCKRIHFCAQDMIINCPRHKFSIGQSVTVSY